MGLAENALAQVTITNVFFTLFTYVVLKFVYQVIYYRFFHPLAAFPGPFWASVTRLWIAKQNLQETEYLTVYDLAKKYGMSSDTRNRLSILTKWYLPGPVVRITPTLLLVNDHSKLPDIYHRNADKTSHYITGSFGETESLFNMRSHKTHAVFRKHIAGPVCCADAHALAMRLSRNAVQFYQHQEDGASYRRTNP